MRRNETENTVQYNGREISVDMILRASEDCMKGYTTSCDKCFLLNIDSTEDFGRNHRRRNTAKSLCWSIL